MNKFLFDLIWHHLRPRYLDIQIDDGVRKVDVITFSSFTYTSNQQNKALCAVDAQNQEQLDKLQQGNSMFVLVQHTQNNHLGTLTHL